MVTVVVHQRHRNVADADVVKHLKPPADAGELAETLNDGVIAEALIRRHGDGGQRVLHIVLTWYGQGDLERTVRRRTNDLETPVATG